MKDKAIIAGMLGLAFLSVAVDFAVYILSMVTDLLFVGGFLYLGWQLLRNRNARIRELEVRLKDKEMEASVVAAANKRLLAQQGVVVGEPEDGLTPNQRILARIKR